jgi:hypothetical protein
VERFETADDGLGIAGAIELGDAFGGNVIDLGLVGADEGSD